MGRLFEKRKCPGCGEPTLETFNFIKATIVVDGQRAPDSYKLVRCQNCSAEWKLRGERFEPHSAES